MKKIGNKKAEYSKHNNNVSYVSGQTGAIASKFNAAGTDTMVDGMDKLKDMYSRVSPRPQRHFRTGGLFEAIVSAKENADLAEKGSSTRVIITHLDKRHRDPADVEWKSGNNVLSKGQMKFGADPEWLAEEISDQKYKDMKLYVPSNKIERVKEELLKKADDTKDLSEKSRYLNAHKNLEPHDTTSREVIYSDKKPGLYAFQSELKYVGKEALVSGGTAAATSAIISGGISILKNAYKYSNDEITGKDALKEVGKDTGKSAAKGGIIGAGGTAIRYGGVKTDSNILSKSSIATAIAAGVVDCGVSVYKYAKGEITGEQATEQIGQNGFSTMSGIYTGASAGMIFGPVGAAIGSISGYIIASSLFQSSISILNEAKLAKEESERIRAICEESLIQMQLARKELDGIIDKHISKRAKVFDECFNNIESAITSWDADLMADGLAVISETFGKSLPFKNFDEFDELMLDDDKEFVL